MNAQRERRGRVTIVSLDERMERLERTIGELYVEVRNDFTGKPEGMLQGLPVG